MKSILKTLILSPSLKKWLEYSHKYKSFFKGRESLFDETVKFIQDFWNKFDLFPTWDVFEKELSSSNELKLFSYLQGIVEDSAIQIHRVDEGFLGHLVFLEKTYFETDLYKSIQELQTGLVGLEGKDLEAILLKTDEFITDFHRIKNRVARSEEGTSALIYGARAIADLREMYAEIQEKKHNEESLYYDLGLESFAPVQMKAGDLVLIGGFTSQCKSVWLRWILYRMLIEYGLNCALFSFEMSFEVLRVMFAILHANNKNVFPGTPPVPYEKFKMGELSDEEQDFLFNVANEDFINNRNYGTLYIERPNKSKYRLYDLQIKISELEAATMPVHVVGVDYLSLMYPVDSDRGVPDSGDYNQLIKNFKSWCLSHRGRDGNSSPILGISPCQISRRGYETALKNEGCYDLTALKQYSELETSGDIILTSLLTPEMRQSLQVRLQNLKNRDGAVVIEPIDLSCDLAGGYTISELETRSESEMVEVLKSLDI